MATQNMKEPKMRLDALGLNFGELFVYSLVAVLITAIIVGFTWYGLYWYPLSVVEERPLVEEVPLEIMPRLPSTLEEAYDIYTDGEVGRLSSFGYIDEDAGIVHIPVAEAERLLLDEGFPTRGEVTTRDSDTD
ncbi:MAG: hypothetical protein AAF125_26155 [Chloroflexota bacterium]